MLSIPFHIAYLLTQHEYVIVPGLGAFVISPSDKEKTNRWGIISPPVNYLEFDQELKHDDGLLANSIEEERQCSYGEACTLINRYVKQTLNSCDRGKSVHIPWVGVLYQNNNRILFQPDKVLSCNSINYGLAGFSLPYIEDLRRETPTFPKQNKAANYLRQSNITSSPRQNNITTSPIQNSATTSPKQNSPSVPTKVNNKETFSFTGSRKHIIYVFVAAAIIAILMISIWLNINHSNFSLSKSPNIIQMPTWNPGNDETKVSEAEEQVPDEPTEDSAIESTTEHAIKPTKESKAKSTKEPVAKPATKSQEELPTQSKVGPPAAYTRQSATTPKTEASKVESVVPRTDTPANTQRAVSNNYYYIIVASWPNEIYAKNAQTEFHSKGFRDTGVLYEDKKYRIYVNRFDDRKEAEKFLIQFRQDNPMYENAWILKQ